RPPFAVVNLQGRTFMPPVENPFLVVQPEVARLREQTKIIIVDLHAEATSEKIALARLLDGRVSAVFGTHTHVQTADEQIFPGGGVAGYLPALPNSRGRTAVRRPTAIELAKEGSESNGAFSLSSRRGRRGPERGGPSCLRFDVAVSTEKPLAPLVPRGEREKT